MHIEDAFVAFLKAHAGLSVLIGARLYPDELPEGVTYPAVGYITISDVKDHTHQGQSALESPVYQFTAYADTRAQAQAVAEQIKAALSDYRGAMGGIEVQYIKLLNELTTLEKSADGLVKVYTTDLEYEINYMKE